MKTNYLITTVIIATTFFVGACKKSVNEANEFISENQNVEAAGLVALAGNTDVYIYPNNTKPINEKVFGINNEWREITGAEFPDFKTRLADLGCKLFRFPGGWESEHYDWATNTTPGWSKAPAISGATPAQAKTAATHVSFVLRISPYMDNPTTANLNLLKEEAYNLVIQHSAVVKSWQIGNEWWLQWAGGANRAGKLSRYATLAKAIAQRIKDADPNVEVYVTGQWQVPTDFQTIKTTFDSNGSWGNVDGLDVHVYAGDDGTDTDYHNIEANFGLIKTLTGKTKIFASEWAAVKGNTNEKRGLRAANIMTLVWHNMVRAGLTSACYWPAPNIAWGIGLMKDNHPNYDLIAVGQAFKWLSTSMKGFEVHSSANLEVVASKDVDNKEITVIIPTQELVDHSIKLRYSNTDIVSLVSAQAMYMSNPDAPNNAATIANITVDDFNVANNTITVKANPLNTLAQPLRGPNYELIKIVVKYQ